jgi:hypothetical protein
MKKPLKLSFALLGACFLLAIGWISYFLFRLILLPPGGVEVEKAYSPDAALIAIVREFNGSATHHLIDLQNRNQIFSLPWKVSSIWDAKKNKCGKSIDIEWKSNDVLLIKYDMDDKKTQAYEMVKVGGRIVNLRYVPRTINASAPCGSMGHNFKK